MRPAQHILPLLQYSAVCFTPLRRRALSPRRRLRNGAAAAAAAASLPDEILEDIFLRLDAAEDLARTSASCTTFRRVVSARRFLRRFRSLHTAPVLGLLRIGGLFHPAEPPHRSAPAARALEQAADFTFSFLPDPGSWRVCDARDGRVLLYRLGAVLGSDLVVCDPLYRRYVQIPSIPEDLLSSAPRSGTHRVFLAPVGDDDETSLIRLIYTVLSKSKAVPFVFSSDTGEWGSASGPPFNHHGCFLSTVLLSKSYARGFFYWASSVDMGHSRKIFLMLDPREMNFSCIASPVPGPAAFVDEGEYKLGLWTFGHGDRTLELYCKDWRNNGVGAGEWQHEKSIPLPEPYDFRIACTAQGCLLLQQRSRNQWFMLNVKTLLVERLCSLCTLDRFEHYILYAGFPPPLALPSI